MQFARQASIELEAERVEIPSCECFSFVTEGIHDLPDQDLCWP